MKFVLLIILGLTALNGPALQAQEKTAGAAQDSAVPEETVAETVLDETQFLIEDPENTPINQNENQPLFSVWDFIRMILILGAVLGVIYIIFHFLRKAGSPKIQESQVIKLLSTQSLGSGKSLHLIEIGPSVYLLGAAENAVSLIDKIEDKETLDTLRLKVSEQRGPGRKNFSDLFSGMFRRGETFISAQKNLPLSGDFLRKQRERLKRM